MNSSFFEFFIILLLVALNGFFSLSEMALVSARKIRLEQMQSKGNQGAAKALRLLENPSRFLSTIQIGITLISILSGAFGGATLAVALQKLLARVPLLESSSQQISMAIVVLLISFLSIVFGELIPKQIALQYSDKLAAALAPVMNTLTIIAKPMVSIISWSTGFIFKLTGFHTDNRDQTVTVEDVRSMISSSAKEGVIENSEKVIVERVLSLDDRSVASVMRPRTEISFIDIEQAWEKTCETIIQHPYEQFPVYQGNLDTVLGILDTRILFRISLDGTSPEEIDLRTILQPAAFLPDSVTALDALEFMHSHNVEIAIIIDEFSGVLGLVTRSDVIAMLLAQLPSGNRLDNVSITPVADDRWLIDGLYPIEDFKTAFHLGILPREEEVHYETLGGMILALMDKVPRAGDSYEWNNLKFEVVDMDDFRIDKVMITCIDQKNSDPEKTKKH